MSRILLIAALLFGGGAWAAQDAATALVHLDQAMSAGVDPGQLTEQLLGYFRDMMTVLVGCKPQMLLYCTADDYEDLREAGQQMGLTTVLRPW